MPHQVDNYLVRILFKLAGVSSKIVRNVSVGGDPKGTRLGEVLEGDSDNEKYSWEEVIQLYPNPDIVTGSQRFYRKYGVRESSAHARCESHFLGDGTVNLSATSDSMVGKLGFGTSLNGVTNPVWVKHCRIKYRISYF